VCATIHTQRCVIKTLEQNDYDFYQGLFTDPEVMAKFEEGRPKTKEELKERFEVELSLWKSNNPYSTFSVFEKETKNFIGQVALVEDEPGYAEIYYLFNKCAWGKGYATETSKALIDYAIHVAAKGYLVKGKQLIKINATARPDNPGSIRILEKIGLLLQKTFKKFGSIRHYYEMNVNINSFDHI
jgi:RimJ/RimL family protein N-acetyltransferase